MTKRHNNGQRSQRSKMTRNSSGSSRPIPIPLEPLKEGHRMDPGERLFLDAAERGDKASIIRCLQGPNPVNVNCTNMMGRSGIQIAVDNENIEIVELLLKQDGVKIGDALLYAIREGVYRIVEMLIDHHSISRKMLGPEWANYQETNEESPDYSPDISPVILAAHCNQFEILQLLLSRGARIDRPHRLTCSCRRCQRETRQDSLRHSLLRIHTYRALASPAWISLTSSDPVLTAFRLSWDLDHLASRENEFKDTYAQLSSQCKKYACDLLEQCRSSEEVLAVLNKENEISDDEDDEGYDEQEAIDEDVDTEEEDAAEDQMDPANLTLDRLKLALKYEQKQFVAHPHTQQLLASVWYGGIPGWRKRNSFSKILIIIGLILIMPIMAVIYLIMPKSKLGLLIRSPFMKFMYHSASFGVFLLLLIVASTNVSATLERKNERGPIPTLLEVVIFFFVMGMVWAECKQIWEEGLQGYIRQWWNWLDFIMLSLYLATISLRIVAYFHRMNEDHYGPTHLARTLWPDDDPTLISEGVFAVANVFSFARIIFLFQANPQLGPLQISLGCMLIDIGKFLFIFFLVLTSFACGLNQLYYYYSNEDKIYQEQRLIVPTVPGQDVESASQAESILVEASTAYDYENAFDPLDASFSTLFWAMFGLIALNTLELPIYYAELFGKLLFAAYNVCTKVLLLNMLIAMMTKSFQNIVDHADREWKFARSKLWMGYFDEGSTLPPPFNLIISPKSIGQIYRKFKKLLWGSKRSGSQRGNMPAVDSQIKLTTSNGDSKSRKADQDRRCRPKYQEVMRRLVSRYIHQWKKQLRQDGVNEDDLLEIKQDISSLRYELREDRKREAARTTGHIDNLKRDILRSIRSAALGGSIGNKHAALAVTKADRMPYNVTGNFLTQGEVETLRREITSGLREELQELASELSGGRETLHRSAGHQSNEDVLQLPTVNSDLYHTHLYTQL